jgi:periplasmic protein TonB
MADSSLPPNHSHTEPDDHLARLYAQDVEAPWYKSFIENLKELVNPPKLPPLEVTSQPVAVKDIWGLYGRQKKSWMVSTGFQTVVAILLVTVFSSKAVQEKVKEVVHLTSPIDLAPPPISQPKKQLTGGGGGGGDRSPLPAAKGRLPKPALRQFTPPQQVIANQNPKLSMEPTIIAPPDLQMPNVNMAQYGDPLAKLGPPSNGPGSGGGIGSGSGGGVGPGKGGGFGPGEGGGFGGGVFRVGGGVTAPALIYKVEPEYSEEARKAKYQGTVLLYVQVDSSGKAINMRVLHSLGLGLDEKAMEAVRKWKFKPGMKDGKPVTVEAQIEVNFRLL